jgi:NAD(P)-dependent dehydrogenase (short-subunit alcohol dehydrogenase family)
MRALITGGARRLGAAIARALSADGWDIVVHYNQSAGDADELAADIASAGGRCGTIQADLARQGDVEGLIARCIAEHGPLDCLVNNASHFVNDTIADVTWESFQAHLAPNLAAPLLLSRDFAAAYRGESGCIINLLDQKLANLNPDFLSYTLSKIGLAGLTEILAMALAPRIRVCGVAPGLTMIARKQSQASFARAWRDTPLGRSSTPEEIAGAVRFILGTPSITGQTIILDGGESLRGRARDVAFDPAVVRPEGDVPG